jgi:chromosomal replication initiation ATPase DnaA
LSELRGNFKDGQVLREDNFLDEVRKINRIDFNNTLPLKSILEATCCQLEIKADLIFSPGKSPLASNARGIVSSIAEKEKISIEEIADVMKRDGCTISSLVSRFSMRYGNCAKTKDLIEKILYKAQRIAELQA